MTRKRKSRRRSDKLIRKAIEAYDLGGCPFCEKPPEDFAPYTVGADVLGQTIACCGACAEGRIVSVLGIGVKMPDDQGTQWSIHDRAFFELHPHRRFHVRKPWRREAEILTCHVAERAGSVPCNAVFVVQLAPGIRTRFLCPFPNPEEADEAGDEAIAAQTGQSVAQLLAKTTSALSARFENALLLDEMHLGLAWTGLFSGKPWQTYTPTSRSR